VITVIANLKGGSGKSTFAFNLALWLREKNQNIIAFDLDPQGTLTDVAEVRDDEGMEPLMVYTDVTDLLNYKEEHVLIDVGASNMQDMKQAIIHADRIIIPVSPSQPDLWATQRFLKIVNETIPEDKTVELIAFVNRADTNKFVRESDETEEALNSLNNIKVLPHRLCQRTMFRRTLSEGMSINEIAPNTKSAIEFNTLASALYAEIN